MRQKMNALQPLSRAEALRELLHDAEEGFLCFDPISPLKPHLGEDFKTVSDRLRAAIATRYAVQPWDGADYLLHKQADHLAAASEAFHVTGWSREDIRDSLQIRLEPVAADPLPLPRWDAAVGAVAAPDRGSFVPGQAARTDARGW